MPSGGKRPGSGRPRKAEKYARPIARAEKKFADRLPEVAAAMLELALGVQVESPDETEKDSKGKTKPVVYVKAPDFKAAAYVLDRILGKPTERVEHAGDQGGPIRLEALDAALAKIYPAASAPAPAPILETPAKKPTTRSKAKASTKAKSKRKPKAK